ncbi:MAG: 4Fe-4S dicluster domain-containing protein [Armatimonadota bacterium]|nr:4Fe-4S dicluster domain-containing protein [Armatimonadota bacterium]MDW8291385.1 4Fe-4S dicluster domain-containing protein [Armatimonadota bacterium]
MSERAQYTCYILPARRLQQLFDSLKRRGYQPIAPTVRDGAIVYEPVDSVEELPIGYSDEQRAGVYRLRRSNHRAFFEYVVSPHSWKRYLYPPRQRLWRAVRDGNGGFDIEQEQEAPPRYAFVGVRACELAAIRILDRVFLSEHYCDEYYARRREETLLVAVNCTHPAGNCFCTSVGTGPRVQEGHDLVLTEVLQGSEHFFLVEVGSARGAAVLEDVDVQPAAEEQQQRAQQAVERASQRVTKRLDTEGLKELLYRHLDSPHWEEVAKRCLTCSNCTMVCPTCFCHTIEDVTNLQGTVAERWRQWDSCFHVDFSYIHGSPVRVSESSRYRQWITHKLASWQDQFGVLGCVGCGRCITWCPVGIDITEEVRALRQGEEGRAVPTPPKEESHANA